MRPRSPETLQRMAMAAGARLEMEDRTINASRAQLRIAPPAPKPAPPAPTPAPPAEPDPTTKALVEYAGAALLMQEATTRRLEQIQDQLNRMVKPKTSWVFVAERVNGKLIITANQKD